MQFTDLRIPIATRMQLAVSGADYKSHIFSTQLLGFRTDISVLAFFAKKPLLPLHSHSNAIVRVGLQSAIVRFESTVQEYQEHPFPYVHLTYPKNVEIEQQLRRVPRFDLDIPIRVVVHTSADSEPIEGEFLDISLNGARLGTKTHITTVGSTVTLLAQVLVAGVQQQLQLTAEVKSVSTPKDTNPEEPATYGVTFIDAALPQQLLLQALCYELQADKLGSGAPRK